MGKGCERCDSSGVEPEPNQPHFLGGAIYIEDKKVADIDSWTFEACNCIEKVVDQYLATAYCPETKKIHGNLEEYFRSITPLTFEESDLSQLSDPRWT